VPTIPKKPVKQSRARRTETIKFLTFDETKRLFENITSKRDKAIFLLAYRHGLRASEIGLLRHSDLDLKTLRVMIHRKKGSLSGEHPLQADEVRILKAYLKTRSDSLPYLFPSRKGSPISRAMLDVLIKGYGEKAKLPDDKRHFHVLKHSIATHLLDKGAELRFLQDWLGHANIQNTVIYAQISVGNREAKAREHFLKMPKF
jgi:type 1 fimbriae regulatory protein FimB/type 1 fimbriae regulatory protein FimE